MTRFNVNSEPLLAREMTRLKERLLLLGAKVEERYQLAVEALKNRDEGTAVRVITGDREIDLMEVDLEEECLKVLALHQPVASDLRFIVTVLKVNNDLERIGDLAVNIANVAVYLSRHMVGVPINLEEMATKTEQMFKDSLNALVAQNRELADQVRAADDAVDLINDQMYHLVLEAIKNQPDKMDSFIKIMNVSKALERIADLSTNIAEDVIYLVDGAIVRH